MKKKRFKDALESCLESCAKLEAQGVKEKLQGDDFEGSSDMFVGSIGQTVAINIASRCGYHFDKKGRLKSNMHEKREGDRYDPCVRSEEYETLKRLNARRNNMEAAVDMNKFIGERMKYEGKIYEVTKYEEPRFVLRCTTDKNLTDVLHIADFVEMFDDGELELV